MSIDRNPTKTKSQSVLFLLDGSGSFCSEFGGKKSYLSYALAGAQNVIKDVQSGQNESNITYAEVAFWGDSQIRYNGALLATSMHPSVITAAADALKSGLNTGTDLAPSVDLIREMAKNGKRGSNQHVVVASDGDIFDGEKAAEAFAKLLKQRPNMTVSFVIASQLKASTQFHTFVEALGAFKDRVSVTTCKPEHLSEAISAAANNQEWAEEDAALREDLGKLRTHFLQALEKIDAIESRLDQRNETRRKPLPAKRPG